MEIPVAKTQGIILKKADLSDTDRLLTIYTQHFGKILIRAKGIGKKDSKLKGLIEPFNVYELMLAKSKNIDVLANSYPIREFLYLRRDLKTLALAFYFSELIDKLIPAPEKDEGIWVLLVKALNFLDQQSRKENRHALGLWIKSFVKPRSSFGNDIKAVFEQKLLEFLGQPIFSMLNKTAEREKQHYLASLAGEEIKSVRFLKSLSLIS